MFARIAASGFLLDPDIPTSQLFTSPFSNDYDPATPPFRSVDPSVSMAQRPSLAHPYTQGRVPRHLSFTQHLERLWCNLTRSFTLNHHRTTTPSRQDNAHPAHSSTQEILSTPFPFSFQQSTSLVVEDLSYLRRSWNRVDFLAIVGFWISFCLATSNVEQGKYHIGIFRALSVLRTTRLLAITSGTTVCWLYGFLFCAFKEG